MEKLVTLAEVKAGLRIESNDEDTLLESLIAAASGAVVNYLKGQAAVLLTNNDSPPETPPVIKQATVLLVGYLYRNTDSDEGGAFEMGYLPKPVMALLYPLRDPALA